MHIFMGVLAPHDRGFSRIHSFDIKSPSFSLSLRENFWKRRQRERERLKDQAREALLQSLSERGCLGGVQDAALGKRKERMLVCIKRRWEPLRTQTGPRRKANRRCTYYSGSPSRLGLPESSHTQPGTTGQGCTTGQENRGRTGRNTGSSPPRTCAPRVAGMMRTLGHTPSCGVIWPCIRYHRTRSSWREARLIWPRPFCNPASPSSFLSRVLGQHIPSIIPAPHHPRPQPRVLVGACACVHHVSVCVCVCVCTRALCAWSAGDPPKLMHAARCRGQWKCCSPCRR